MEKIAYAKWIEEEVKADWKMGDLCTYRHAPIVMGQLPEMIFQVNHIQEIHYMAPRDDADGFPKCLGVKTSKYDVPMNYSPKNLRHLTEEELNLVRLRDSKPTEKSAGAVEVVVGGQSVYVDGDTGEVL